MKRHPRSNTLRRAFAAMSLTFAVISLLGCPLGRKDNELGGECHSFNDCPMGTTGLRCANSCADGKCPKSFCTKSCAADGDCVSKVGAMVCKSGECAFAEK